MLSLYLAAFGLGGVGLGVGLLVQGPLALDRRIERTQSDSAYVSGDDAMDLHADRRLGALEGDADAIWRPLTSPHCWTVAAAAFGAFGLGLSWAGLEPSATPAVATALGLASGYGAAWVLRSLPPRSPG